MIIEMSSSNSRRIMRYTKKEKLFCAIIAMIWGTNDCIDHFTYILMSPTCTFCVMLQFENKNYVAMSKLNTWKQIYTQNMANLWTDSYKKKC